MDLILQPSKKPSVKEILDMPLEHFFSQDMMDDIVSHWNSGSSFKAQFRIGPMFLKRLRDDATKSGKKLDTVMDLIDQYSTQELSKLNYVSIATIAQLDELLNTFGLKLRA